MFKNTLWLFIDDGSQAELRSTSTWTEDFCPKIDGQPEIGSLVHFQHKGRVGNLRGATAVDGRLFKYCLSATVNLRVHSRSYIQPVIVNTRGSPMPPNIQWNTKYTISIMANSVRQF